MLELSEDFKVVFIKPLQQAITNMLETNEKHKASLSKDKEPNGNFRTGTFPRAKRKPQNPPPEASLDWLPLRDWPEPCSSSASCFQAGTPLEIGQVFSTLTVGWSYMGKGSQTACIDCPLGGKRENHLSLRPTHLHGKENGPRASWDGLNSP